MSVKIASQVGVTIFTDIDVVQSSISFFVKIDNQHTVFPRFSAPGRLPIFEVFGGALNRAGALARAGALIKTYENLDLPFPGHTRTLFIIYDN